MKEWVSEIKKRAALGKPPVFGGRSKKLGWVSFDDLTFIPVQLTQRPVDYFREDISTKTVIGKSARKPLKLEIPILIAAMSFGALSKEAKIVLARASSAVGTATNTGEGGMLPEEREEAKILIAQYSTGRFGVDEEYIRRADAIEIKIGQGAKPGQGGLLPGEKVTTEIAKLRRVPVGKAIHSPPAHPDIKDIADLRRKVEWLRELNDGPIIIKLAAGNVEKDVELAVQANPDVIAVDGMEGGTGAAPAIMLDEFGIPTLAALVKARQVLDRLKAEQDLLIGGGLNIGADVAKALALGADAVFMGFSLLVAMGCTYCKMCWTGKCPVGITTQDPELRKRLSMASAVKSVVNYLKACSEEVKMVAGACGKRDIHELSRANLRALNLTAARVAGVELV
jgi:glutamate synthase domain-containing protein 2